MGLGASPALGEKLFKREKTLGEYSSLCWSIAFGIPQGSILSPKLFLLYINYICKVSKLVKLVLFTDKLIFLG